MRSHRGRGSLIVLALACVAATPSGASERTPFGKVVENIELTSTTGAKVKILGDTEVNAIVFFKPGQEHSASALKEFAAGDKALKGKSVRFVAVVSDRYKAAEITADVKAAGLAMPVLFDAGDSLYATLAMTLTPTVCLLDKAHKLVFVRPFAKVNYWDGVRAQIRFMLKEISESELRTALDPPQTVITGDESVARRFIKMAELQLKSGNADKALESARKAVDKAPKLAVAHAVLGAALAAKGDCKGATAAFDHALALDAKDARAADGKKACAGK